MGGFGGYGGAGGAGGGAPYTPGIPGSSAGAGGAGGVGIIGSNLTVINSGTISGGLNGSGPARANAITFTGGTNRLELQAGSTIVGNVDATAGTGNLLTLGGAAASSFDVSKVGAAQQYRGFTGYEKTGSGTWTLTNTTTAVTPWTLKQGILSVSSEANLGASAGALTFNGGTLENTASFTSTRNVTLNGGGTFLTDADLIIDGVVSGGGALTKEGGATLVLNGANTYTGQTLVSNGTLQAGNASAFGDPTNSLQVTSSGVVDLGGFDVSQFAVDLSGNGEIRGGTLRDLATFAQSGGTMAATSYSTDYALTGGTMSGSVIAATQYEQDGGLTSGAVATTQYKLTGGTLSGSADTGKFELTGNGAVSATGLINIDNIIPGGGMTQDGANTTMAGTVAGPSGIGNAPLYALVEGTMAGNVHADAYQQSGGLTSGTVIATQFVFTGGTMNGSATTGTYDQSGGLTQGAVTATKVEQSGGTMAGTTDAGTYQLTGGLISGMATAATLFDMQAGTVSGHLTGAGMLVKSGNDTVFLSGTNNYTGGTVVQAGTLVGNVDSIRGNLSNDAAVVFDQAADALFAGTITGGGGIVKKGDGRLLLSGLSSAFAGSTTVEGGALSVNGTLGGTLDVQSGGRLMGSGTVGTTSVAGTVAPGNSIGTLTVAGDITLEPDSTYEVEVEPGGTGSDQIHATGKAFLKGGKVVHVGQAGTYEPNASYTILKADAGVSGTFGAVTSSFAFLDPKLSYDPTSVYLRLVRNDVAFASAGQTPNQRSVGGAVDLFGPGNPIWNAVVSLSATQAESAFDGLSGEIHASARTVLVEDSRFLRDAVNERIRAAFAGVGAAASPVLAYGETDTDGAATAAFSHALAPADTASVAAWGSVFGSWGSTDGDGNAAGLDRSAGGFFTGIDGLVAENVRLGIMTGYSHSSFDVDGRASSGSSDSYHLGLYGGTEMGALGLRSGLAYSWHDISTARSVAFPGFADSLSADYNAGTFQAFGEAGYRIDTASASFEPFANLAYVSLHTDGFAEKGGAAALTGAGRTTDTTFTTLGMRASTGFDLGGMTATARGMVGWRHAFGDTTPPATQAFAFAGASSFAIAGTPIAKDAAVLEAGLDFAISDNATLGLSYTGQFGAHATDNGAKADFDIQF
ncbi:autotransporter domain-containing protein [Mesorhizobium sp. 8]|uniref:autotransporter outer membrane beta-barrel domain-containing protein n=1 Tax=Mesorhizobium sp. 8 TaxID=2584466 RepID=UPI001121A285|nr:autotransporter domain-containing protein [Mesorhizobium sp. 8]QDB99277.1 autotransporter outer membrane beta-barrel domain-containing protein [Mesorhizobium sp. 8]